MEPGFYQGMIMMKKFCEDEIIQTGYLSSLYNSNITIQKFYTQPGSIFPLVKTLQAEITRR